MLTREFEFEKATKRTFRFKEIVDQNDPDEVVGTLYVQQDAFEGQPKKLRVVIEEID